MKRARFLPGAGRPGGRRLHPVAVRVMHWTNALCMVVMITSGMGIYDDDVVIRGLYFPQWLRLGGWAAPSLNWHFLAMWPLAINGLVYLTYGFATGRLRERLLPVRPREVAETIRETLHFRLAHEDLTTYNAVQKILYMVAIAAGVSQVVSGLALWKPVQLAWLVGLVGGFQTVRVIHFTGMSILVGFLLVHVALSLLVPRTLLAMVAGGPRRPFGRRSDDVPS